MNAQMFVCECADVSVCVCEYTCQCAFVNGCVSVHKCVIACAHTSDYALQRVQSCLAGVQCRRCKRRRFDPWVGKIPWSRK